MSLINIFSYFSTTTIDNGGCPDSISRRSGRLIMASGIATRSLLSLSSFAVLSAGGMNILLTKYPITKSETTNSEL